MPKRIVPFNTPLTTKNTRWRFGFQRVFFCCSLFVLVELNTTLCNENDGSSQKVALQDGSCGQWHINWGDHGADCPPYTRDGDSNEYPQDDECRVNLGVELLVFLVAHDTDVTSSDKKLSIIWHKKSPFGDIMPGHKGDLWRSFASEYYLLARHGSPVVPGWQQPYHRKQPGQWCSEYQQRDWCWLLVLMLAWDQPLVLIGSSNPLQHP